MSLKGRTLCNLIGGPVNPLETIDFNDQGKGLNPQTHPLPPEYASEYHLIYIICNLLLSFTESYNVFSFSIFAYNNINLDAGQIIKEYKKN